MKIASTLIPSQAWIHTYMKQPYWEGFERLRRAVHGVNYHLITEPRISLKERVVSLAVGTLLVIPLVNTIVWVAMQVFSEPEKLGPPFIPKGKIPSEPKFEKEDRTASHQSLPSLDNTQTHTSTSESSQDPIPEDVESDEAVPEPVEHKTDLNQELETPILSADQSLEVAPTAPILPTVKNSFPLEPLHYVERPYKWRIWPPAYVVDDDENKRIDENCTFSLDEETQKVTATLKSTTSVTTSIYSSDGLIQEYHFESPTKGDLHLNLLKDGKLEIKGQKPGSPVSSNTVDLKDSPWIQQSTLGFRSFILSPEVSMKFSGIHPTSFELTAFSATKGALEMIEGHGQTKYQFVTLYRLGYPWAQAWFDQKTGILIKGILYDLFPKKESLSELQTNP